MSVETKALETTTIEDGVATRMRPKKKDQEDPGLASDLRSHLRHLLLPHARALTGQIVRAQSHLRRKAVHGPRARHPRENVQTPAGTFSALLVEPEMVSGGVEREERLHIWYSDDERHLPVRIRTELKFGSVTATLKSVTPGAESSEPPLPSRSQLQ